MAKKQPVVTRETMTPEHLPDGTRPEEFLRDEDLVGFYERHLATFPDTDSKARRHVERQLAAARRAAALTATVTPIPDEEDEE